MMKIAMVPNSISFNNVAAAEVGPRRLKTAMAAPSPIL